MVTEVKGELARLVVSSTSARRAEVVSLLRVTEALHVVSNHVYIEAVVDLATIAARLSKDIHGLYGYRAAVHSRSPKRNAAKGTYVVRIDQGAVALARQSGLLDTRGRPIRGLPAQVISGDLDAAKALWRAAFLARGSLTDQSRGPTMVIDCPNVEVALALVGAARRLGVSAKTREVHGHQRVMVPEGESINMLLKQMGATHTRLAWEQRWTCTRKRLAASSIANFTNGNAARTAWAAAQTAARVEQALTILGDDNVPDHLASAGKLRLTHRHASLDELACRADPPLTKDALAGRLRRLLAMADRAASAMADDPGRKEKGPAARCLT